MNDVMSVERVSAPMQVMRAIRDAIRRGELKEGDKLPPENELAKQLKVGRSSFREGMRLLSAYGVVEIRQGEGTFIINKTAEQVFEFMGFFPDNQNIDKLIELRRILEIGSLQIAAAHISKEDIDKLEAYVEGMVDSNSSERSIFLDKSFHELLIHATGNELLIQIYAMLGHMQSNLMNQLMCHTDVLHDAKASHREILDGLKAGNVDQAVLGMGKHLDRISQYVNQYIPS